MTVSFGGEREVFRELRRRFDSQTTQRISDKALKRASQVFIRELKRQFETFRDTGASIDEITVADPVDIAGVRIMKVHWRGPKDRYRIIHLNEWGTVRNPNPRGKGKIAIALRNSEQAYREAIKQAIMEGL